MAQQRAPRNSGTFSRMVPVSRAALPPPML
jgi:hypothetical protein